MREISSTPHKPLVVLLSIAIISMLIISVIDRMKNPNLTVRIQQVAPQATERGMSGGMGEAMNKMGAMGTMMGDMSKGDMEKIGALMQEVGKEPKNLDKIMALIEALMIAQNWSAAETFINRAMTLDSKNTRPLYMLGVVRHNQGKPKEAAEVLEKVLSMDNDPSVRYSLGVLYLNFLNEQKKGLEYLTQALNDPKSPEELKKMIRSELEKAPVPEK